MNGWTTAVTAAAATAAAAADCLQRVAGGQIARSWRQSEQKPHIDIDRK